MGRTEHENHVDVMISAKLFQGLPNDLNINIIIPFPLSRHPFPLQERSQFTGT